MHTVKSKEELTEQWRRMLDSARLRDSLVTAAVFIALFEQFKELVVRRPRVLFADRFTADGPITGEEYQREIPRPQGNQFSVL